MKKIISIALTLIMLVSSVAVSSASVSAATSVSRPPTPKIGTVSNQDGFLNINWSRVSGAAQYCMWYQVGNNSKWNWVLTNKTYWNIQHPKSGTKFTIKISSMNKSGTHSNYSATKTITFIAVPKIGVNYTKDKNKFEIKWGKIEGAESYEVVYFYKGKKTEAYSGKETSFIQQSSNGNSNIAAGGPYYYQIRAVKKQSNPSLGSSAWANAVGVSFVPKIDISKSSIVYDFGQNITNVRARYDYNIYWNGEKGLNYKITFYEYKSENGRTLSKTVKANQNNNNYYELWDNVKYSKIAIEYADYPNYRNVSKSTLNLKFF